MINDAISCNIECLQDIQHEAFIMPGKIQINLFDVSKLSGTIVLLESRGAKIDNLERKEDFYIITI